ncbi:hypothetical protein, partial [Haloferax profundi]|uniref:hypothetical protein n=1 Tax=Haloferax profundi TaxID=1544718 RepID=UPI000AA69C06
FPGESKKSGSATVPDDFPFGDDVDMPGVGEEQSSSVTAHVILTVDLVTSSSDATVGGTVKYNLAVVEVSGGVDGSAFVDLEKGDLTRGEIDAYGAAVAEYPPPPTGIPNPPIGVIPPNVVSLYPIFELEVEANASFDEVDDPQTGLAFEFTEGVVSPQLSAKQEIGKKYQGTDLVLGFEEGIDTQMPMSNLSDVNGTVYGQLYTRATAYGFSTQLSYPPGEDRFTYSFDEVSLNEARVTAETTDTRTETGWTLVSKTGTSPPKDSSVGISSTGMVSADAIVDTGTITDDVVDDDSPALASLNASQTAVWSRQDPDKSVLNGRDIYTSSNTNGAFDTPSALTDDNYSDYEPALAGNSSSALAAFLTFSQTFNESTVSGPSDLYGHGEIRFVTRDSSGWSSPQTVTNDSNFDSQPTVAHVKDTYLIAWQQDGDGNLSTWGDQSVQYVTYNGTLSDVKTIDSARTPALSAANGTFTLSFLTPDSSPMNGSVSVQRLSPTGSVIETQTHPVSQMTALDSSNGSVAWLDVGANDSLHIASNNSVSTVPIERNISTPQAIDLTSRPGRLLVGFRAHTPGSSVARVFYKARANGTWLPARKYADGSDQNLTFWQGDSAPTTDGFVSVFAGKDLRSNQAH